MSSSRGARGVTLHSAAWSRMLAADPDLAGLDWRSWDVPVNSLRGYDDDVLRIASAMRHMKWDWKSNRSLLTDEGQTRSWSAIPDWEKHGKHWIYLANCLSADGLQEFVARFENSRGFCASPPIVPFEPTDADLEFLVASLPKPLLKKPAHAQSGTW